MRRKKATCVYCGKRGTITRDHIPPRCLWSDPKPNDLITVPRCIKCNTAAAKDDEYFKTMFVMKEGAGSHPEAIGIHDSVLRGLRRPEKTSFRMHVIRNYHKIQQYTPSGLYLGSKIGYDVNLLRLDNVVRRITRGLYWHHFSHQPLPNNYVVDVWSESGLMGVAKKDLEFLQRELINPVLNTQEHCIGRSVFRYWFTSASDHDFVTGWFYEFFGDVRFAACTMPPNNTDSN